MIGISPCSRDVFAPLLNKLVYVLDSLMAGHYTFSVLCAALVRALLIRGLSQHLWVQHRVY